MASLPTSSSISSHDGSFHSDSFREMSEIYADKESIPPDAPSAETEAALFQEAQVVVKELRDRGISVLAFDFDRTFISIHTSGVWRGTTDKLCKFVRPYLKALMKCALLCLHVCVVTYSQQPDVIADVLRNVLPDCDTRQVIIRANTADWMPPSARIACQGKQDHIAWVLTELYNSRRAMISPPELLLLDDHNQHVVMAREFGHQALMVTDDMKLSDILFYARNIKIDKSP